MKNWKIWYHYHHSSFVISVDKGSIFYCLVYLSYEHIIIFAASEIAVGPPVDEPHMLLGVANFWENPLRLFNGDHFVVSTCYQGNRDRLDGR